MDHDDFFEIARLHAGPLFEPAGVLEDGEGLDIREDQLQLGVDVEQLRELALVVAEAGLDVPVPVGQALDKAGDNVRGRFGDDGRPFLQCLGDLGRPAGGQNTSGAGVDEDRHRNGNDAAEKIPVNGCLGQAAQKVVAGKIDSVGQGYAGIEHHGMRGRRDAEPAVKDHRLDEVIQQRHGEAGIHEGIGEASPADIVVPVQQRRASEPAAAQHGLQNIAQARDAKPDEGAAVGQEPPVLGQGKCGERRNEPGENL